MDSLDGRMYDGRDLRIQMAKYGRPEQDRSDRRLNVGALMTVRV